MKFLFLIKSKMKNCQITSCQHPLLDSARIKSSFFSMKKSERIPTSLATNTSSAKSHFTPAKKVLSLSEEMLSVTNQMVRTLQRDNSNKFDSQQSHPAQGHQRAETENDSQFSQKKISNGFII